MTALLPCQQTCPRACLRIDHLGLDARDALLLESALRMHGKFANCFSFGSALPDHPVQVMFVNGDNERALARWQALREEQPDLRGVLVSREAPARGDLPWVPRPITVRDCKTILDILAGYQDQLGPQAEVYAAIQAARQG